MLKQFFSKNLLEAGIDEVARGCLAGRVYSAAVIWPKELDPEIDHPIIKDSKKLSKKRREYLKDYIEETAIDFSIGWSDENCVDNHNILNATYIAMHNAIDGLNIDVDFLIVDGNRFKPYCDRHNEFISHKCIIDGDAKYVPIACASILAKVYHDKYIEQLCDEHPELHEKYGWRTNMCYGTSQHIEGIKQYGLTPYHRKTFGICKNYI
tara:strand:- start:31 stop:657 length:627 start_codon:yes stop_codon:yes gene_type:complete